MAHIHSHGHSHGHDHHHDHSAGGDTRAFKIAIALNSLFVAVEFAFSFVADSTALIADAGHNLSDVLGLALTWWAGSLSRRPPNERYTYGLRSTSILAALANAVFLLFVCGAIALEATHRLVSAHEIAAVTVSWVAGAGIFINGFSALLFMRGAEHDLNIRGAYLHMLGDAAISLGVVVAGIAMLYTRWYWLDPVVSLMIVAAIVAGTWGLLRESLDLALNAVPPGIDVPDVEQYLRSLAGVEDIHDLHIWGMSTTESALTVHLVMPEGYPGDGFMDEIMHTLESRYKVQHSTLQVEQGTTEHACTLQPAGHIHL
jgi:cobalt-zinc-cadmium efflux system protein